MLQRSSQPHVKNLIRDEFEGACQYITTCGNCKRDSTRDGTFYELDLGIEGFPSVNESLEDFISVEVMRGDNKYMCSECGLQEAEHRMALQNLPHVLNVQLLRFKYDVRDGRKKKIRSRILVPLEIDMAPFLNMTRSKLKFKKRENEGENAEPDAMEINLTNKGADEDEEMKDVDSEHVYVLTAVLNHQGASASGGHYTAYILDSKYVL